MRHAPKPAATSPHLLGETLERALMTTEPSAVDMFGGKVFVRWDPNANVTSFGPAADFLEFLKTNGLWERWVEDCPLSYRDGTLRRSRTFGHGDAFGAGGPLALRAYYCGAQP